MKLLRFTAAAMILMLVSATGAFAQDDAALFKSKCQSCHGADGKGDTAIGKKLGVRNFHSPEATKESDNEWFDIVKKGKDKMPGYDGKLTDDQIKALVKFCRSLK